LTNLKIELVEFMSKLKTGAGITLLGLAVVLGLLGTVLGIAFIAAIPALLGGLVGWFLWNHGLAALFHGPHLGYWQCVGVLWLLGVALGGLRALLK
jgi:hypothetical protein